MAVARVAVTGLGVVSPFGRGLDAYWSGLLAGRCPSGPVDLFDASAYRVDLACRVPGPDPLPAERAGGFALEAAREAVAGARLTPAQLGGRGLGPASPSAGWAQARDPPPPPHRP